jgi:hypothetical protein
MKNFFIDESIRIEYYSTSEFKNIVTQKIVEEITQIVSSGFGRNGDDEDIKNHIFISDSIGLIYKDDELYGFATTQNFTDINVCYLCGVAVHTTSKGFGSLLVHRMFHESEMPLFSFTTQNPGMYLSAQKSVLSIYPNPEWLSEEEIVDIGRKIVSGRQGHFLEKMAIMDLYPDCLYPRIPIPENKYLWQWWQKMLRIDEFGKSIDGIVFVGKIK